MAIFLESVFKEIWLKTLGENEVAMSVRSDNGGEFVATAVSDVCKKYGIKKLQGPAYSPWVQGAVERFYQTLKHKLIARMHQHKTTRWTQFVRDVTDEYNNTQHSTTQMIPTEAWKRCWRASLSNETLEMKLDRIFVIEQLRDNIRARGESERQAYLKKNPHIPQFRVGDIVLVRGSS